jgi:hypothetical protein
LPHEKYEGESIGFVSKKIKKLSGTQLFIFARNFENFSGFRSTQTSLETLYGFDVPKFRSQKITETDVKRTKKFLCKTNNLGLRTRNSGFQKHEVSDRKNKVSVRKTRSFDSKTQSSGSKTRSFGSKHRSFGQNF